MELIERSEVLDFLQTQFDNVEEGEGHCVFVSGESGIGKTSLIKAFCKRQQACNLYQGSCDALFTPRPLSPLYDIMWQLGSELWPYTHKIEERADLFSKFFHELSLKKERVLIVFEDIHWADEATLDFIKFFARRVARLHCLFVLTYRDDEIHSRHPLRNVLGDLSPDTFKRIQLKPLSRRAVYKLADEKGYDAENVYNISGGNPFYVNEILASYSPGVPENIKDSILSVYDRQEEGTKNVWQIFSVIPEGLEINRYAKIKASWDRDIDHCFALKIIIIKNDRIIFKHELYRRTIENSLSPFKRIEINKKLLDLFLDSFEENGEIERIVHYAKNSNENKLVVKYAPIAAKQAAGIGAHIEASKLYLTAIEYSEGNDTDQLVQLYEAYAYECYLVNQIREAIIYQGKALKIWQEKNEKERTANCLRFLSRFWWFDGNRDEAEKYAKQAIEILQLEPSSKAKAMTLSNMSQLKMFSEEVSECVAWGNRAIEMGRELNDEEVLSHALNNVGSSLWKIPSSKEHGKKLLMESLDIALKNSYHEQAARAYSNIIYDCMEVKDYNLAEQFLEEGINYCEERDLDASKNYKLYLKARMLLETGYSNEAELISENLLANSSLLGTVKIGALSISATIKIRRGKEALAPLLEAKTLAFKTKEHQRIIPVIIALLEYEWLTAKRIITDEELKAGIALVQKVDNMVLNSQFDFWLEKARRKPNTVADLYEPYKLLKAGKISIACSFWEKINCPYEKALVLFEGNENDKKNALQIFQQLGADAVYEKSKMEMRAIGIKKIPRGLRESTRTNPAQLTNRELDVLQLLKKAVQNKEIAETLYISPKTVDHHISSILFKLDVNSRSKAVAEADRMGIIK